MKRTKTNLLAVGVLLAALSSGFSQPVIINQPQWQTNAVGSIVMFIGRPAMTLDLRASDHVDFR